MAKNSTKDRGNSGVQRITTVDNPNQSSMGLFVAALGLILVGGVAATVFLASQRESNIDVAPLVNDHWHSAYLIHNCGNDLPPTANFDTTDGLHTHGAGLLHLHPFNPTVSGKNATLGEYFEASGSELTDESFTTGFSDVLPTTLSEAEGCGDGEPAQLQLAVWRNAFDETAEPEIITEDIADFRFDSAGMALTLALLPEGAEIPRPPQDRIDGLAETGPGGPIAGVEEGETPFVTTSTVAPEGDADAEAEDGAESESDSTEDGAEDGAGEDGGGEGDATDADTAEEDADS